MRWNRSSHDETMREREHKGRESMVVKSDFRPSATWERRSNFSPAKVGYLDKKATKLGVGYQKRYFVASGHYLRYFSDSECSKLLAAIDVQGVTLESRGKRGFVLSQGVHKFVVRCGSQAEREEWLATLEVMRQRVQDEEARDESRNELELSVDASHPTITPSSKSVTTNLESLRESMTTTPRESWTAAASGALLKWSEQSAKWKSRYCVACGRYLRYYGSDDLAAPLLGAIDLEKVTVKHKDCTTEFSLEAKDIHIRFKAADHLTLTQWTTTLVEMQNTIRLSVVKQRQLCLDCESPTTEPNTDNLIQSNHGIYDDKGAIDEHGAAKLRNFACEVHDDADVPSDRPPPPDTPATPLKLNCCLALCIRERAFSTS